MEFIENNQKMTYIPPSIVEVYESNGVDTLTNREHWTLRNEFRVLIDREEEMDLNGARVIAYPFMCEAGPRCVLKQEWDKFINAPRLVISDE